MANQSDFISKLLHGVTAAHMLHLRAKGTGSYASHKALGSLYEGLQDQADSLAEECMGVHGMLGQFPSERFSPPNNAVSFVEELYQYVKTNRDQVGDESHLQNTVDGILSLLASTLYKLKNLS